MTDNMLSKEKNDNTTPAKAEYDDFGFLKNLFCPHCGSEKLKFSHKDDVGTEFYRCTHCGRHCYKPKTKERKDFEKALTEQPKNGVVRLSHLNMIEDPRLAGKPVAVEAVASSTSIAFLTPSHVEAIYTDARAAPPFGADILG